MDTRAEVSGKVLRQDGCTKRVRCGGYEPPAARRRILGRKISFSRNTNLIPSISCAGGDSRTGSWSAVTQVACRHFQGREVGPKDSYLRHIPVMQSCIRRAKWYVRRHGVREEGQRRVV